jgi:hypothetical protein
MGQIRGKVAKVKGEIKHVRSGLAGAVRGLDSATRRYLQLLYPKGKTPGFSPEAAKRIAAAQEALEAAKDVAKKRVRGKEYYKVEVEKRSKLVAEIKALQGAKEMDRERLLKLYSDLMELDKLIVFLERAEVDRDFDCQQAIADFATALHGVEPTGRTDKEKEALQHARYDMQAAHQKQLAWIRDLRDSQRELQALEARYRAIQPAHAHYRKELQQKHSVLNSVNAEIGRLRK